MVSVTERDSTFEQFLEFVPDAIVGVGRDGKIVFANRQAEEMFGYRGDQMVGQEVELLVPQRFRASHPAHRDNYFREPRTRPMGAGIELFARRRDGTEFPVEISLSSLHLGGEAIATAAIRDISDRAESEREKALQLQLDRARRLESVGQLAGGVAHDFNNILGVIMNYAEFVAGEVEPGSQAHEDVEQIRRAADRAAALTRQLLIFSRRERAKPEVLFLGDVIGEVENLLERALGERIELRFRFDDQKTPVEIDPGQLEQVLVNLAVNARDAMPEGGLLLIEVDRTELDEEYVYMHPDTTPGTYVRLKVSDTGVGMNTETAERVFEPFFTTKEDGTGLGLATVYGIVTGAGGRIDIYSEPGVGTTVKVHLPATEAAPKHSGDEPLSHYEGRGEVVLIVEDEPDVRGMAERILSKAGYSVIGRARGADALDLCEDAGQSIDLLLTDVIMPGMLGTELVERARALRPGLKVVYMSGYSHEVLAPAALLGNGDSVFVEKPFSAVELLRAVGKLLGEGQPHGSG